MSPPAVSRPARLALGLIVHDRPERTRALIDAVGSAIVETMRVAATHQPEYYSLISGACWPTKSPAAIVQRLCGSGAAGFIDLSALDPGWWPRLDQFHLSAPLPTAVRHNLTRVRIRLPHRDRSRIPTPYGGSCWLDLRGDVLAWLVARIDADPGYRRKFAFTHIADEIFFHTLLMDSPYRDQLVNIHDDDQHLLGLRYIRWATGWHPQTLTDADLEAARQADCIFARKRP
jgi:hypothetical protein